MQPVSPLVKLLGESVPVVLITFYNRIPLHDLFPDATWAPALEWPVTLFISFWIVNAFNLIDGINGLAGVIGILALTGIGILGNPVVYQLSYAFAGALLAFLFFNFAKPRIFMGDCGSLPVGYTLAFGLSHLCYSQNSGLPADEPFLVLALMIIPLFDMCRVFMIRMYYRKNPFKGDRNHLHHLLLETGMSHVLATTTLAIFSVLTTVLVWLAFRLPLQGAFPYLAGFLALLAPSLVFTAALWMNVRKIRKTISPP
jgi:UDP-N-acetylmuramyl pentapeptide phosphotransferase/UDP-N-acetylglucosamine-1-phosphate transferase